MKANELRIGNYLQNFLGEVFKCNSETIRAFENNSHFEFPHPKPIPLTDGWLFKLGFDKVSDKWVGYSEERGEHWQTFDKGNFYISHQFSLVETKKSFYFTFEGNHGQEVEKDILFVHQLQNLYFALTGEELICQ